MSVQNSTLSGANTYFLNNASVNFTNSTIYTIYVSTNSSQQVVINNVSSYANNLSGYVRSGDAIANLFNSTVAAFFYLSIDGNVNLTNSSILTGSSIEFTENSSVLINNTTILIANYYLTVKFEGNTTTISDSYIGKTTGSYYAWSILFDKGAANVSNSTIYSSGGTFGGVTYGIFFRNASIVSAQNSTFTGIGSTYFLNNASVNFTNSTILSIYVSTNSSQQVVINNVSSYANNLSGYLRSGDAVSNFFNSTVVGFYLSIDGNVNLTNSSISTTNSIEFTENSSVLINNTTVSIANYYLTVKFEGNTTTISDSYIGKAAGVYYAWRTVFDKGAANVSNSTINASGGTYGGVTYGIFFRNASIVSVQNSTLSGASTFFQNSSIVNATSTTFIGKSFSESATLYHKNYFKLFVNDSAGRALRNVSVSAYNATSGEVDAVGVTDEYGWLNTSLLWYWQNATQAYNISLTVNVSAAEGVNQSEYNMSVDRYYNATIPDRFGFVIGSALVGGFTANVTAYYGNSSLKPWNGSRQVEFRSGVSTLVANLTWNFSAGDLNLSNMTITRDTAERYVGINGTNVTPLVTTVWVPVWGKNCNVRVCAGKANYSHCAAGDWVAASSVQSGEYCVLAVNGTVVQDRPTAITTKMVIKVPGWDAPLVGALFAFALLVFVLRGTARPARTARRTK